MAELIKPLDNKYDKSHLHLQKASGHVNIIGDQESIFKMAKKRKKLPVLDDKISKKRSSTIFLRMTVLHNQELHSYKNDPA